MASIISIDSLKQLAPFANDENLIEIVMRKKNKRFKSFQKILLRNVSQTQKLESIQDTLSIIEKDQGKMAKNLGFIAKQEQLNLLLNGLNLCATCAGFAIIYKKLDKIGAQISQQIAQLSNDVKQGYDTQANYKFNQALANHTDMLDKRRLQQPYSEEKLRELVDQEYNVLILLIDYFKKGISKDHESMIFSIFSLLSMFTVTLLNFDEVYYANNYETLKQTGDSVWHSSHNKWMSTYSILLEKGFVEKLQDFTIFEKKLSSFDADIYYVSLLDQVHNLREEVETNQQLITALYEAKLLNPVRDCINSSVRESIDEMLKGYSLLDDPDIKNAYTTSLQQAAL